MGQYPILSIKYEHIPKFLTNGKTEMALYDSQKKDIALDRNNYQKIVSVLNQLIKHINDGREIKGGIQIPFFATTPIPKKHVLKAQRKKETDYMDPMILQFWETYVKSELRRYLSDMKKDVSPRKHKTKKS